MDPHVLMHDEAFSFEGVLHKDQPRLSTKVCQQRCLGRCLYDTDRRSVHCEDWGAPDLKSSGRQMRGIEQQQQKDTNSTENVADSRNVLIDSISSPVPSRVLLPSVRIYVPHCDRKVCPPESDCCATD